jgi:hypothetical protein
LRQPRQGRSLCRCPLISGFTNEFSRVPRQAPALENLGLKRSETVQGFVAEGQVRQSLRFIFRQLFVNGSLTVLAHANTFERSDRLQAPLQLRV